MIALLLWLLATLDAAFAGYRDAAGRNALINKRRYYRRAMWRGALMGQLAVGVAALIITLSLFMSADWRGLLQDYEAAGARMLTIYLPYAFVVLLTFLVRWIPSVDLRSITSTVIFGPFTLIRPLVAVVGMGYGVFAARRMVVVAVGIIILAMMLSLEAALSYFRRAQVDGRTF
jgi:hypothetical protein